MIQFFFSKMNFKWTEGYCRQESFALSHPKTIPKSPSHSRVNYVSTSSSPKSWNVSTSRNPHPLRKLFFSISMCNLTLSTFCLYYLTIDLYFHSAKDFFISIKNIEKFILNILIKFYIQISKE